MVPVPDTGRCFTATRRVRLGDVDPAGRARLDAIARWLQDVARDDARDAGLAGADLDGWIVRWTTIDVLMPPRFDETVSLTTFCGGVGPRWAERRTSIAGDGAGRVEAASLWICVDAVTGRPRRLPPLLSEQYLQAAQGRTVSGRRRLPDPPAGADLAWTRWPLRRTDLDVLDHVNNAAWFALLVEASAEHGLGGAMRATVEHITELKIDDEVDWAWVESDGDLDMWIRRGGPTGELAAAARLEQRF